MTEARDPSFSAGEAVAVQAEMRNSLGLPPERFPLPAFVGMISDEIEQLRAAGRTDTDIVGIIQQVTGQQVPVEAIASFYASPEKRHG